MVFVGEIALLNLPWDLVIVFGIITVLLLNLSHFIQRAHYMSNILDSSPLPWCIVNVKTALIVRCSPRYTAHFQGRKNTPLNDLYERLTPEEREAFASWMHLLRLNTLELAPHILSISEENTQWYSVQGHRLNTRLALLWFKDITDLHLIQAQKDIDIACLREHQAVLDALPFPVWKKDQDTNKITYVNATYADFIGRSKKEIYQNNIDITNFKLVTAPYEALTQHHFIVEGERRLFTFHHAPNTQHVGYATDKTDTEQLRLELQRHIRSHHDVLELLSTGIAIYGPDMRLTFFNHAYGRMTSVLGNFLYTEPSLSEVLEELRRHRLIPEFADFQAYKKSQLSMFTSLVDPVHELLHLPNGQTLRMVIAPHPLGGLIFLFEDVTDALSLESQFNTLIAVQKATIDNLYEGVAVFSSDNRLKLSNPVFGAIWQLKEENHVPGKPLSALLEETKPLFFHGGDWEALKEKMIDNLTDRKPKTGRINRVDGRVIEFAYVPLPDGANMVSYSDVTASDHVERALRERNEALEATDRLKSQFIANVSYELRSPLNTIIGFTEILLQAYFGPLNNKQKEYAQGILESSQQLLALINGILDLASIEAGHMTLKPEPINVHQLLVKTVNLLQQRAQEHGLELSLLCHEDLNPLVGDERHLQQALTNLITNSINFTPEPGRILVKAYQVDDELIIEVTDTGVGISPEDQDRVFDRFERVASLPNAGVGLGLSLVKNFIELHQGHVQIISQTGQGTTVVCRLPYSVPFDLSS